MKTVKDYIEQRWETCIIENREDIDTLIGVPYPYTIPAKGFFNELYYWDTYFTNAGLIVSGRAMIAKNNTDNMLYLVDKYGFMPNGTRTFFLSRSQPPYLSQMVRDVYEYYNDRAWLVGAYSILQKEYDFWQTQRISSVGLNIYGGDITQEGVEIWSERFRSRVNDGAEKSDSEVAAHCIASAESGWDMTPRWGFEAHNYVTVDLNSLMYLFEKNMKYFSEELDIGDLSLWTERMEKRKFLMEKYMRTETGLLADYNVVTGEHTKIFSVAAFYPMFAEVADEKHINAVLENLNKIETEFGILTCEKNSSDGVYQWNYPNGWPCLQYVAMQALLKNGYNDEALRIAKKYTALVEKVFEETGKLWEKYNVVEGNILVSNEYEMPEMMGWTAGVYLAALELIKNIEVG